MKYKVMLNGVEKATIQGNKTACKMWIRDNVIHTHMGEWRRTPFGYEYSTTIGRYYQFQKVLEYNGHRKANPHA